MRKYGISVHEAASYVVGLLALGILPEVPENLKALVPKPRKSKKKENDALSGIRTHAFYLKLPSLPNKRAYKAWFKEHDIRHPVPKAVPAQGG